mmetsp:Transcript_60479/g.194735  ORF Transcript_60479/g.194735 Transcript_60479/m.194735 type:complete len:210 (+) Transcript_60479:269-898(+)
MAGAEPLHPALKETMVGMTLPGRRSTHRSTLSRLHSGLDPTLSRRLDHSRGPPKRLGRPLHSWATTPAEAALALVVQGRAVQHVRLCASSSSSRLRPTHPSSSPRLRRPRSGSSCLARLSASSSSRGASCPSAAWQRAPWPSASAPPAPAPFSGAPAPPQLARPRWLSAPRGWPEGGSDTLWPSTCRTPTRRAPQQPSLGTTTRKPNAS